MDAPTPKNEIIEISYDNKLYNLIIEENSNKLSISLEEKSVIENLFFITYSKEELSSISTFFNMFECIQDIIPSLIKMVKNKQYTMKILSDNELILEIFTNIEKVKKIKFILKEKELDTNQLIKKLIKIVKNYEKENKELKERLNKIENELLPYRKEKEKLETIKNENLLKESTILSYEQKQIVSNWILPNSEKIFTLLYKLTKDGSNCSDFHNKCDKKGPTLVMVQSNTGYKFGGIQQQIGNNRVAIKRMNLLFFFQSIKIKNIL